MDQVGLSSFSDHVHEIAGAFVGARRDARGLNDYPGPLPSGLSAAYLVQDAAIALDGRRIGGWKVGKISPPVEGVDRLAGPIFADTIVPAAPALTMPVFSEGFAAAEAEYLLQIGASPEPGKLHFTRAEAAALLSAVHVGIEVASSPFPGINALGPAVTVSDFGNNNGLVVGAALDGWRDEGFNDWPVTLSINGVEVGAARAAQMLDGPIGAARFLFELMARRSIVLPPGTWISSGAVTGVHPVRPGDVVAARFGTDHDVECAIRAA